MIGVTFLGLNISGKSRTSFSVPKSSTRIVKPRVSHSSPKPYAKKAPCAGLGKPSRANGLIKSKIVPAHTKRTSKGYKLVNPYARSK